MPKRHEAQGCGVSHQLGIERGYGGRAQFDTGTEKSALRDVAHRLGALFGMSEKLVEFGLNALAHATQKQDQHRGQRQFAVAGKCVRKIYMPGQITELAGLQVSWKRQQVVILTWRPTETKRSILAAAMIGTNTSQSWRRPCAAHVLSSFLKANFRKIFRAYIRWIG